SATGALLDVAMCCARQLPATRPTLDELRPAVAYAIVEPSAATAARRSAPKRCTTHSWHSGEPAISRILPRVRASHSARKPPTATAPSCVRPDGRHVGPSGALIRCTGRHATFQ